MALMSGIKKSRPRAVFGLRKLQKQDKMPVSNHDCRRPVLTKLGIGLLHDILTSVSIYFASAVVAADSSHMTASSSAFVE